MLDDGGRRSVHGTPDMEYWLLVYAKPLQLLFTMVTMIFVVDLNRHYKTYRWGNLRIHF